MALKTSLLLFPEPSLSASADCPPPYGFSCSLWYMRTSSYHSIIFEGGGVCLSLESREISVSEIFPFLCRSGREYQINCKCLVSVGSFVAPTDSPVTYAVH